MAARAADGAVVPPPAVPSWLAATTAAVVTGAVYLPTLGHGFVWDDGVNLVGNPAYRGLGWAQLRWMFSTLLHGHYIPLTWLTFGLDYLVWGLNPVGYHLTNVVLQAAAAAAYCAVAERLLARATTLAATPRVMGALVGALFFAIHPLRVESVAWVTERRDVLSGLLLLLTILGYLAATDASGRRRRRLLAISVGCYLLALAAKSIVMTLPAVLVLLDVYPGRRLPDADGRWFGPATRAVWLEKVPYGLLAAVGALVSHHAIGTLEGLGAYPWATRVLTAFYGLWFYLVRTAAPVGLSPVYEIPVPASAADPRFLASILGVLGVTAGTLLLRRRWPAGLAVWVYCVVVASPVLGLVARSGFKLAADRYSYLPALGLSLLVAGGAGRLAALAVRREGRPAWAPWAVGATVIGLLGLGGLTWQQSRIWRSDETLWRHAVATTPVCAVCHHNLATVLIARGELVSALDHLDQALAIRPGRLEAHGSVRGVVLEQLGRWPEAVAQYERVLARHPDAPARVRLGLIRGYLALGEPGRAREEYRRLKATAPELARPLASAFPGD
ncbi:MAG TPA: tetratricopeptide repeat protein [Methylomirabilota bacterium]|nr:tetratricopeptide repeat protein [Methylomirabilota bacterium]